MASLPSCPPRGWAYREPSSPQHTPAAAAPPGQPQSADAARCAGEHGAETLGYTDRQRHRRPSVLINPTSCLFLQVWADLQGHVALHYAPGSAYCKRKQSCLFTEVYQPGSGTAEVTTDWFQTQDDDIFGFTTNFPKSLLNPILP